MGVGIPHHLQTVEIDVIQAAVGEAAQHDVIKAVRRTNLVAVDARRIAHRLAHAGRALLFELLARHDRHRLRGFDIGRFEFGGATLHLRGDNDGFGFRRILRQQRERNAAGHPSHQQCQP
ncbi:hypothetical protein D3C72_1026270 [compost metagenome]